MTIEEVAGTSADFVILLFGAHPFITLVTTISTLTPSPPICKT